MGSNRVVRGGSWINNSRNCRCAYRNRNNPGNRNDNIGFRVVSSRSSWADRMTVAEQTGVPIRGNAIKRSSECMVLVAGDGSLVRRLHAFFYDF